jgi:hypothetical protein
MIRAPFDEPTVLRKLRRVYKAARIPSVLLPGACDVLKADGLISRAKFRRFDLAHRGKYEVAEISSRALADELRELAQELTGTKLGRAILRLQRFRRGGYALFHDDALTRGMARCVEVTLDLSHEMAGTPAIYRSREHQLVVPQSPGLVAVVRRTPGVLRYDRYLPAAVGRMQVLRLRAAFEPD